MRRSERIVKATVWGLCVCLGGYLAARGYLHLRQSPGTRAQQILGDICMETEREAYLWYMPGIFYEEGTTTPLITKLWTKIENWYPLGMYLKEHQEEEQHPVIEDESTCYEMIHANGNTIADRLLGENQSQAVTRENETARENEEKDMSSQQEGEQEKNVVVVVVGEFFVESGGQALFPQGIFSNRGVWDRLGQNGEKCGRVRVLHTIVSTCPQKSVEKRGGFSCTAR